MTAKQRLRAFVMGGTRGTGEAVPAFAVWGECTYENEYVKENGVWKIAKLYGYFNMYTPYSDGWGKTAMPITKVEKRLPPDRPPTREYEMFPTVTKLDYHYANPGNSARLPSPRSERRLWAGAYAPTHTDCRFTHSFDARNAELAPIAGQADARRRACAGPRRCWH